MAGDAKPSKKIPKVIQLTDEKKMPAPVNPTPQKAMPGIQSFKLIGSIKEKGFADESKAKITFPEPRVTPFPKARHRSEGPHWAPINSEPEEMVEDTKDAEDSGVESLAAHARPLERKMKKTIDFSNWKEKLKMEKCPSKKLTESKKMGKPTMITSIDEGKEQEIPQALNEIKDVKALSAQPSSESSAVKLTADKQMKGELSAGITGEPGELVQISKEENAIEDTGFSASMQSDDTIARNIDSVQIKAKFDTTKEIIKGHAEKAYAYRTEREGLKPQVDIEEIDAGNRAALQAMSANEIEEAQNELIGKLRPEIAEMLRKRGAEKIKKGNKGATELSMDKKSGTEDGKIDLNNNQNDVFISEKSHKKEGFSTTKNKSNEFGKRSSADSVNDEWKAWSDRVESVRTLRFSLDGNIVSVEETAIETTSFSQNGNNSDICHFGVHNVAERDILRTEGDPASAGYTIKEAISLVRSTVPGQRAIALNLIAAVLDKALVNLHVNEGDSIARLEMSARNKSVDWQAVWAYAIGPEPELILTLRMALDDSHSTVVVACAKVLQRLLSYSENESYFNLLEMSWPGEKSTFVAPIFRKQSKLQDGFLGGGFWKYSAKPSNMFPFSNKNDEEDVVEEATIGDDTSVAGQDVAAGLIRMGVLPRIRYILEVDQLAAAEESLLSVVISLARHSPPAVGAVTKCPRLIDTIIQRYINQQADIRVDLIQVKAVHFLKVLCEANKSNCIDLIASGVFQSAVRHLFFHHNLDDWLIMGEESFRSTCAILVEELRLWNVCIKYGLCVSCFSDFYPALCFWLSPPSFNIIIEKNIVSEFLSLARESFIVLEALSRTLPNLHSFEHGEDRADVTAYENWSWSRAVPMVEVALKWLNFRENTFLSTVCKSDKYVMKSAEHDSYRIGSLGVISAVLHLLSCIIEKIVPAEGACHHSSYKEEPSHKWLPVFFPQVCLEIIKSGLLYFPEIKLEQTIPSKMEVPSLLKYLCHLREETDHDTSLLAVSCIHGLIRLITSVDKAINIAQIEDPGSKCMDKDISKCHKILKLGIALSCQDELKYTLNMFMDLVTSEWHYIQCSEVQGRGGPAPGIGIGWGATNGGWWSRKALVAQADARLTVSLLDLFPSTLSECVQSERTVKKINAVLGIVLITGPKDMLYMEKTLNILLSVPVMEFLSTFVNKVLKEKTIKNTSANVTEFCKTDFETFSKVLLVHFRNQWLMTKRKKSSRETQIEPKTSTGIRNSHKKSLLGTICEESAELGSITSNENMSLGIEWAHQRLPVPVQWLLSPLSMTIDNSDDALLDDIIAKEKVFNNVRSGLFFLIGLEAMYSCNRLMFSLVSCIPLVRKIHALSMVFILGGDVFLEASVNDLLATLQQLYGEALDEDGGTNNMKEVQQSTKERLLIDKEYTHHMVDQKDSGRSIESVTSYSLNFQRDIDDSYQTFMETFIEHFGATSYGDVVFGRQVAIYLRRDVESTIRLTTWNALASGNILELLPTLEDCCGHPKGYLSPPEEHEKIIEAYVFSWVSGNLDKAAARMAVTFSLALHHIAAFIFSEINKDEKLLLRKKLARSLILGSSRKPHHQARLLHLIQYDFSNHFQEYGNLKNESSVSMEETTRRSKLLSEACEGDPLLLAEVQKLQAAALAK
ncbi:transcriptional elongation regulator MINIYO isoform X2 [Cryptomeria japonica]|uniref:transcriptional elongation regulator MINIYO isoform X2 n=1 Tax=Cryptomeria japonica TaxID=3369 RepID=UPI0027D9D1AF|nr:transcriptional elongation regulator MINIYO isoform X2 [Cryptomeria japonica]